MSLKDAPYVELLKEDPNLGLSYPGLEGGPAPPLGGGGYTGITQYWGYVPLPMGVATITLMATLALKSLPSSTFI